jgi:hypothetical protein
MNAAPKGGHEASPERIKAVGVLKEKYHDKKHSSAGQAVDSISSAGIG